MFQRCRLKIVRFKSFPQRFFSQILSLPDPRVSIIQAFPKPTRVRFKAHEKEAAILALQSYLANVRGISLQDASLISKGSPAFIRKLLISSLGEDITSRLPLKFIDVRSHIEAFLEKGGVNEVEPFFESIGHIPRKTYESLPELFRNSSGLEGFVRGAKALADAGVPWNKVGKVFANNSQLLDLTAEELSARIHGLERLGFNQKELAGLLQVYPSALKESFQKLVKPAMEQLEQLGVKQQVKEYLCGSYRLKRVEFGESNMQKIMEMLALCKLKNAQISQIVSAWPQIILGIRADEIASRIASFKGLMLTDTQIGKIILRYPEILATSSKKNPKRRIQLLENIGFQREEIGKLILRDPHIFHNCTESSLHSKMDYFETLGINKESFRKVITSFPGITGCSLELNLKQKVQLFESIGLRKEVIANIIMKAPSVLALSVDKNIKPKLEFLEDIGVTQENIAKILMKFPAVMYLSVEQNLKPKVEYLKSVGYDEKSIIKLFLVKPSILGRSLDGNLFGKVKFLMQLGFDMGSAPLARALGYVFSMSLEAMELRLHELEEIGLTKEEIRSIVRRIPGVLYLSKQQLNAKIQYLTTTLNCSVKDLVKYPVFLDYSLEKRIKPRHRIFVWLNERGLLNQSYTLSLNSLSESRFLNKFVARFPGGEEVYNTV